MRRNTLQVAPPVDPILTQTNVEKLPFAPHHRVRPFSLRIFDSGVYHGLSGLWTASVPGGGSFMYFEQFFPVAWPMPLTCSGRR